MKRAIGISLFAAALLAVAASVAEAGYCGISRCRRVRCCAQPTCCQTESL